MKETSRYLWQYSFQSDLKSIPIFHLDLLRGDPRLRSQYSSASANRRFVNGGGNGIQADAETRAWAHNHNATIVAYSEKVLQDSNNVVSSKELKWRDKF